MQKEKSLQSRALTGASSDECNLYTVHNAMSMSSVAMLSTDLVKASSRPRRCLRGSWRGVVPHCSLQGLVVHTYSDPRLSWRQHHSGSGKRGQRSRVMNVINVSGRNESVYTQITQLHSCPWGGLNRPSTTSPGSRAGSCSCLICTRWVGSAAENFASSTKLQNSASFASLHVPQHSCSLHRC